MNDHDQNDVKTIKPLRVLVMGVSGSGKSTIASNLAKSLDGSYIDGDDLHPQENIQKMSQGEALNDEDRKPWLKQIAKKFARAKRENKTLVVACSALKRAYRDQLREGETNLYTIFLDNDFDTLEKRMSQRAHFMPTALLKSQFETLERPIKEPRTLSISNGQPVEDVICKIVAWLS
ncbi:gluconokinase [Ningiella sp. W23]|uniref:gluconokinase n=1 Tax=Ningiella sp. W23 TaxID=3023715 RepID=UPI003757F639